MPAMAPRLPADELAARCERIRLLAMIAIDDGRGGHHRETLAQRLAALPEPDRDDDLDGADRLAPLAARLDVSPLMRDLAWTAIAAAVDPRIAPHLEALTGERPRAGITLTAFAAIHRLDERAAVQLAEELSPLHPWFVAGLLTIGDGALPPLRPIAAARRFCMYVAGSDDFDDEIAGAGGELELPAPDARVVAPAQREVMTRLEESFAGEPRLRVLVHGPSASGRRTAIALASGAARAVHVDLTRLPHDASGLDRALQALAREATLRDAFPILVGLDEIGVSGGDDGGGGGPGRSRARQQTIEAFLARWPRGCGLVASHAAIDLPGVTRLVRQAWPTPDAATRESMWRGAATRADQTIEPSAMAEVASRFAVGVGVIERATAAAARLAGARHHASIAAEDIRDSMRAEAAERLAALATRIPTTQTWDDVVLPPDVLDHVRTLIARARHSHLVLSTWGLAHQAGRATGIAGLLSGPPGTGKTMLAGVIAVELGLDLYQVELSRVVSKWIGETEKALGAIFDAAATGQVLLLFDEADSLFAKRTEVKSSVDRYANLEVNYLLQRVESFTGITLLTTNLDTSIDPALRRRLAAHIRFFPPDEGERAALWTKMLRSDAPVAGDIDVGELAATFHDFTGANIRNAVLSAAFLAAAENVPLSQALLERAARSEASSMGRVLSAPSRR
jgi:hypothetical protein